MYLALKKMWDDLPWYGKLSVVAVILFIIYRIYTLWEYILDYRKHCKSPKSCANNPLAFLAQIIFWGTYIPRMLIGAVLFGP